MAQLVAGASLRIGGVIAQFGCSKTTAKRDLANLRQRGRIVFQGSPRTGNWRAGDPE